MEHRLERRFGRYAFDNFTLVLVGAQTATLVLRAPSMTSVKYARVEKSCEDARDA